MENYLIRGANFFVYGVVIGCICYGVILLLHRIVKKRKHIGFQNFFQLLFCIWFITILLITGILPFKFQFASILDGISNTNLIPFVGGSLIPMILNLLLFVPLGFLFPLAFRANWKKVLLFGGTISFCIELLQLFGGRFAEIDDWILNSLGALVGYELYDCCMNLRIHTIRSILRFCSLGIIIFLGFSGISLLCNHEQIGTDGIMAVEDKIEEVRYFHNGEWKEGDTASYEFILFCEQLSNCGGHIIDIQTVENDDFINNNDYYIEIAFIYPQTITFYSENNFTMKDVNKLIYNTNTNTIYWGNNGYQNMMEYTKFDDALKAYESEIIYGYDKLNELLVEVYS